LGNDFWDTSWDDKFFTPLNKKYAGKTNPDMYGVVVHANVVSMIINEDYIDEIADWQETILAIVLCFLNIMFCVWVYRTFPEWYDGVTKLVQVIEFGILAFLMVMIFHWYSYKLDLTLSLAAVALVGDGYEVYAGVGKNLYRKAKSFVFRLIGQKALTKQ
ncbi:MAG TPA: CHASE2 domain-containing protein, partial [Cyclobacteriaceae bacterium]|nr:CHASE2 domain-containing protein [Cyclobacteriaceae bacterium]